MPSSPHMSLGAFAITKAKILLMVSLVVSWLFAGLFHRLGPGIEASFKSRLDEARQKIPSVKIDWRPSLSALERDPRRNYNNSKLALLIEARPLPHLVPQLLHMMAVVPRDWRFLVIGSNRSVASIGGAYAIKHQQAIGKLDLMILPPPWEIESEEMVHRLLTDKRFYGEFLPGVEWILRFEYDSILCANSETSLNEWLEWDWAGARSADDKFSGRGGLSLRRVSAINRVLAFQERANDTRPEDHWFGRRIRVLPGAKVASGSEGQLAVEDVYVPNPMGFHVRNGGANLADEVWGDAKQRKSILEYCPELSLLMDMKLELERCPGYVKAGNPGRAEVPDGAKQATSQAHGAGGPP